MPTNEPTDGAGRPLRQPAAEPSAAGGWAAWQRWGEEVNRALRSKADNREVSSGFEAVGETTGNLEKRLVALEKEVKLEHRQLAAGVVAELERLEARIAKLEVGGRGGPSLSEEEGQLLKERCRAALAASVSELAAKRRAAANGKVPP